jgi:hypothetical protein
MDKFFVGLYVLAHLRHFKFACISINSLARDGRLRKKLLPLQEGTEILLDSGAFTEIARFHAYREAPHQYAQLLRRAHHLFRNRKVTAVSQDMMCEPFMLRKTGLTVRQHQEITIDRYKALLAEDLPMPIMPVIQGYQPQEYLDHLHMYGDLLPPGMWVGVGSVCKRNVKPLDVANVLFAIHHVRPDLKLHGFGVKKTALFDPTVRQLLASADSMAWSQAARWEGRDRNAWQEADKFRLSVEGTGFKLPGAWQPSLFI